MANVGKSSFLCLGGKEDQDQSSDSRIEFCLINKQRVVLGEL